MSKKNISVLSGRDAPSDEHWALRRASRFQAFEEALRVANDVRGLHRRALDDSWQEACERIYRGIVRLQDAEVADAKREKAAVVATEEQGRSEAEHAPNPSLPTATKET
jgi:hypothetical protein